ncbi:DUF4160 domain-containing protein [Desulfovibrio sp. OttesenSCG-928-I05]|nr:DUF4160 domain-containing protein [Desulfovibrio sp. OttesenSCG-928-I05]
MPTILRVGPYRFFFYSHEGREPAHVHIAAGDCEAKFWLANCELASSYGLKPHELTMLLRIVIDNKDAFMEAWNEHFSSQI